MPNYGANQQEARLSALDRETLIDIDRLAHRLKQQALDLFAAVEYCRRNNTIEGLDEMVAFSFNAQQHTPKYGGGGGLPVGPNGENVKYKVMISAHTAENTTDNFGNIKGGYIALELKSVEGPTQGQTQIDRLNLNNTNPKVVEIANRQLSAYCHVIGTFQFNDFAELHNKPFVVEVGLQKAPNPNNYTEVKAVYDINGNEPGKAGSGPQANVGGATGGQPITPPDNSPPAGGVQAQGNGWNQQGGGQPNQPNQGQSQGGGWGQNSNAGQPNQAQQGQGGGYQVDNNVPMPNQDGQPNQGFGGGQPDPNQGQQGWGQQGQGAQPNQGQQGGFQQGQPNQGGGQPQQQGGQPGWGQQQQGGGQPGWGQR